ncbi:Nn.00g115460.m01.CDS01 [Neocucurbitaria sp. VM-36]
MADNTKYYELYRRSSLGGALTDTLDNLITERRIEPQLAMKILINFDKAVADVLSDKVKSRLTFKGHLDTYRFCDDVWTFIIKDINFKLDNTNQVHADRVKILLKGTLGESLNAKAQEDNAREARSARRFARVKTEPKTEPEVE